MRAYLVRAFTKDGSGGNPAGVVLDADSLHESEMQEIAMKIGVSETAFVLKSERADFAIRFYTPNSSVDLCGHATIAAFSLLAEDLSPGVYSQETRAGILKVEIDSSGAIYMDQNPPEFLEKVPFDVLESSLRTRVQWIRNTGLTPQIVSTGLKDILVPIDTREHLFAVNPDFEYISSVSRTYGVVGIHAFTLDTLHPDAVAHCRNFAPLYGISEESATGTSCGALACYLYRNGKVSSTSILTFEQGYSMNLSSEIRAKVEGGPNDMRVRIGGRAVLEKELELG